MTEPQDQQLNQAIMAMKSLADITSDERDDSTSENDVFDGIEDIYADLEAVPPPAPPSSEDDIHETQRITLSSSKSKSKSKSFLTYSGDQNSPNDGTHEETREFPFLCGIQSQNSSSWLRNIFVVQNYCEMDEQDPISTPETAPPEPRVIDNRVQHTDEAKVINFEDRATSNLSSTRDTVIQHTIAEVDVSQNLVQREEKSNNAYLKLLAKLKQKKVFGSSENDGHSSTTSEFLKSSNQQNIDEEAILNEKMKKYNPSFWDVLGQRRIFGVPYRLIFILMLNLFAFILLVVLITRFTRRNSSETDSLLGGEALNNTGIVDTTSIEDESSSANNVTLELLSLCDEEGVTVKGGVILTEDQVFMKGQYFCSPSKSYILGMMDDLAIVNIHANEVVWSAGVTEGARTVLQADGNLVIENEDGEIIWDTGAIPSSSGAHNHQLVFWENNEGVIAIQQILNTDTTQTPFNFWMDGVPEAQCNNCLSDNLEFPVRGIFYFPTFDNSENAWQDRNGNLPMYYPSLGLYSSSDPHVIAAHVQAMKYAKIDLAISSWQGPGTHYDRSRITMLLEETKKHDASLRWTVSYEAERRGPQSPEEIQSDLEYLKQWFSWRESWAHIDGKPILYVNNNGGCDVSERWMTSVGTDWYVVLKLFAGYENCEYQPDSWHDQQINDANDGIDAREGFYYNLAPGQWRMGRPRPDLQRLGPRQWCDHVQDMVDSNEKWQLIISFNDAYLGTAIEPSLDWRSSSSYGFYLDCLHDPQMF